MYLCLLISVSVLQVQNYADFFLGGFSVSVISLAAGHLFCDPSRHRVITPTTTTLGVPVSCISIKQAANTQLLGDGNQLDQGEDD
jgi:hypothetical protein